MLPFLLAALGSLLATSDAAASSATPWAITENHLSACAHARPAIADFDENGVLDEVDGGTAPGTQIRLQLNGTRSVILADSADACDLVVTDLDRDHDPDLVAFTPTGLLVWQNRDGLLSLVPSRGERPPINPMPSLGRASRHFESAFERRTFASVPRVLRLGDPSARRATADTSYRTLTVSIRSSRSRAPPAPLRSSLGS